MSYIVWRTKYTSYSIHQGGYYVKYKNKVSDEFSQNWYDANKYKSIGRAIKRLGIRIGNCKNEHDFVRMNTKKNKSINRDLALSKILDEKIDISTVISYRGRIEMIKDGKFIGNAESDMIDYIKNKIKSNYNKNQKKLSAIGSTESDYISEPESADFWDDWSKK